MASQFALRFTSQFALKLNRVKDKICENKLDLIGLSIAGGISYIIYENIINCESYNYDNEKKINKMINNKEIIQKNITPEEIYVLQFKEKKRKVYEKYITYPGIIINCCLLPLSVTLMCMGIGGLHIGLFSFGYGVSYLVVESDIVNNNISKILNKNDLIIDKKDFLTLREIKATSYIIKI